MGMQEPLRRAGAPLCKLDEDGSRAAWILNGRGLGYRMSEPESHAGPVP